MANRLSLILNTNWLACSFFFKDQRTQYLLTREKGRPCCALCMDVQCKLYFTSNVMQYRTKKMKSIYLYNYKYLEHKSISDSFINTLVIGMNKVIVEVSHMLPMFMQCIAEVFYNNYKLLWYPCKHFVRKLIILNLVATQFSSKAMQPEQVKNIRAIITKI